jgi:hypothetical protein
MTQSPALKALSDKLMAEMYPNAKPGCCVECNQPFTEKNVFTQAGWAETKLSQTCEACFDRIWKACADEEENELVADGGQFGVGA